MRGVAALLAGLTVAGLTLFAVESSGHAVLRDGRAFLPSIVGLLAGTFVGAGVAILVGRTHAPRWATAIVAMMLLLTLLNVLSFPHPGWFMPAAAAAVAAGAVAALAATRRWRRG